MNGLAYEHYIDSPHLIFQGWHASLAHERLATEVEASHAANRPLDDVTVARLHWYPAFASDFMIAGKIPVPDCERILSDISSRFRALANHYDGLAPLLEAKLLEDPESAERLLRWLRFNGRAPFHPEEEYIKRLGEDPNRHYRLTPPAQRVSRDDLKGLSEKNATKSPGWAFMYVSCHSIATIEPEIRNVLLESEEYSYLTALVLRKRGIPVDVWQPLLTAITSHRWAFHVMRDIEAGSRLDQRTTQRLLRIVHTSPPWAVQLWESRGWRGTALTNAYGECSTLSVGHECTPELHSWFRMTKATTGTRVVAVAAR